MAAKTTGSRCHRGRNDLLHDFQQGLGAHASQRDGDSVIHELLTRCRLETKLTIEDGCLLLIVVVRGGDER